MVQIIPKQQDKLPLWMDILFFLSLGACILSLGAFLFLQNAQRNAEKILAQVSEDLAKERSSEFISLEANLKQVKGKMQNFTTLFEERENPLLTLAMVESTAHPQTFFKTMSMDTKTNEIQLEGIAQTFPAVEEQLIVFRNTPGILSVDLTNLGFSQSLQISYQIRLSVDQKLLSSQPQ